MHASLRPRNNVLLVLCWFLVASVALLASRDATVPLVSGLLVGCVAGALQWAALSAGRKAFLATSSALDVRRAFSTTRPGAAYLWLFWMFQIAAVLGPWAASILQDPPLGNFPEALATYACFALARDAITLYPLVQLRAASCAPSTEEQPDSART